MATINNPVTFAIGDRVTLSASYRQKNPDAPDGELVVTTAEISVGYGEVQYGVDGAAWFRPEDLEFVSRATAESLALAIKLYEEEDTDQEDPDEEDPDMDKCW